MVRQKLRRIGTAMLCGVMLFSLMGCSKNSMKDSDGNVYGDYKNLEYTKTDTDVTDKEVEETVENQLTQVKESMAEYKKLKKGTIKTGDTVNISYTGKVDDKKVEECVKEDVLFEVGVDDTVFDGFSSAVTGKKPGDKVVTTTRLAKDFSEDNEKINGKECTFTITVNYIQGEKEVPELTDDLINKLTDGEYKTFDDYNKKLKEETKKQLKNSKEEESIYTNEKEFLNAIRANSEFKLVDPKLVSKYESDYEQYYKDQASSYSMELDDFITEALQTTKKKFNAEKEKQAKIAAQEEMIINFIASKEDLELTDDEYNKYVESLKSKYGYDDLDALKDDIEEYELADSIKFTAKKEKIIKYLKSVGKEVDKLSKDYSNIDGTAKPENTEESDSTEEPEATEKSEESTDSTSEATEKPEATK